MRRTRRGSSALLGAVLVTLLALAGCGSSSESGSESASAADEGPWSYRSSNGTMVKTEKTPRRIIAHADAAASLLTYGIRPVGIFGNEQPKDNKNLKGQDLSGIEVIGTAWGEVDVEKAAELRPDLIVSDWWPAEKAYGGFENGVKAKSKKLSRLAPVIGGAQGRSIVTLLEYYEGLAASLGANVDDPKLAVDKKAFEEAVAGFEKVTADKVGLTAMAVSPADDLLYVAVPKYAPELLDFRSWGLDVLEPDSPEKSFPYWENLSWENADKYQPDLLLVDDRSYPANLKTAQKQPTWAKLKAVKADAVVPWPGFWVHAYGAYAEELTKLSKALAKADPDVA